jgi:uncharacterized protein
MNRLRPILAGLLALGLASCAPIFGHHRTPTTSASAIPGAADAPAPVPVPAPPPALAEQVGQAHPALWKISKGNTVIWLFGTIHALPEGYQWHDQRIGEATAAADTLVLETVLDRDPAKAAGLLFGMGTAPGLPPLIERGTPDKRAALADAIAKSGMPAATLDGLKTWTAALLLVSVPLRELKLSATDGVEPKLEDEFKAANKPLIGLETPEQQLGFFDHLSEPAQRDFLGTVVEDTAKMKHDFDVMLAAWSKGDEEAIAASFDDDIKDQPELREVLLARRNAAWTEWIAHRLDQPGKLFLAVGAGHLAGAGSVIERLKVKGIVAERVQ